MKHLSCEMCGSGDIIKQDGVFVCQVCGCKYSLKEAKKMMIEGTVNVAGTVRVDHSDTVDNYLKLMENALSAGNNQQAELYCNKIIEVDPSNWYAWLKKGHAAGWQSTLANMRITEAITCYGTALGCTEDEEIRNKILEYSQEDLQQLCLASIRLQTERFAKWPDADETNGIAQVLGIVVQSLSQFVQTMRAPVDVDSLMAPIAKVITDAVETAWDNVIVHEYATDDDTGHPGKFAFSRLIDRAAFCSTLLEKVVGLCDKDEEQDIHCYELLIEINNYCSDAAAWDYTYTTESVLGVPYTSKNWFVASHLTDSAVASRNQSNSRYEGKIGQIRQSISNRKAAEKAEKHRLEQEAKKARVEAYWQHNSQRKSELDNARTDMLELLHEYETDIKNIDQWEKAQKFIKKRDYLQNKCDKLLFFRFIRRRQLQKEIAEINDRLERRRIKLSSLIQARINIAKEEIAALDEELTRDRT